MSVTTVILLEKDDLLNIDKTFDIGDKIVMYQNNLEKFPQFYR